MPPVTEPSSTPSNQVGPWTALDHKITATMTLLDCVEMMMAITTFLTSLSDKLRSTKTRKGVVAISNDLKKASKANSICAAVIMQNAQKCAPIGNLAQPVKDDPYLFCATNYDTAG